MSSETTGYTLARHPRAIARMAASEVTERMSRASVLCLPIGAFEQHGPHLPLDTDSILADGFATLLADRWGEAHDIWLLPRLEYGLSLEHAWSPGTISLRARTFGDLVLSLCAELVRAFPARRLLIINGNGGNRGILDALLYEIEREHGLSACVAHPTALSKVKSGSRVPEVHGGMSETSVMLALAPTEVRLDQLPHSYDPDRPSLDATRTLILERGASWAWTSDDPRLACEGVTGDARSANAELGARIISSALDEFGGVLAELRRRSEG